MRAPRLIPPQNIARGVLLILAAALTISIQDVLFKLFSDELRLWQIFALRGVFAVSILLIASWIRGLHSQVLQEALSKWQLVRSLCITATFLAFYTAIPFLNLSIVGAAQYIAPIFVAILSACVIKDAVGGVRWLGIFLGFIGVIVLLQPGTDIFSPWAFFPVAGAAFYALAHIITRAKCQNISLTALSLSQNIVMMMAGIIVSLLLVWLEPEGEVFRAFPYIFATWAEMDWTNWLALALLAVFVIVIGMMLAGAYQAGPPSVIAAFEYSYLVFVAVWDLVFFDTSPTIASTTGMALIALAGLLVLRRKTNDS